jgi:hypothetical protein
MTKPNRSAGWINVIQNRPDIEVLTSGKVFDAYGEADIFAADSETPGCLDSARIEPNEEGTLLEEEMASWQVVYHCLYDYNGKLKAPFGDNGEVSDLAVEAWNKWIDIHLQSHPMTDAEEEVLRDSFPNRWEEAEGLFADFAKSVPRTVDRGYTNQLPFTFWVDAYIHSGTHRYLADKPSSVCECQWDTSHGYAMVAFEAPESLRRLREFRTNLGKTNPEDKLPSKDNTATRVLLARLAEDLSDAELDLFRATLRDKLSDFVKYVNKIDDGDVFDILITTAVPYAPGKLLDITEVEWSHEGIIFDHTEAVNAAKKTIKLTTPCQTQK